MKLKWDKFANDNLAEFEALDLLDGAGNLKADHDVAIIELGEERHIPLKEEWERFIARTKCTVSNVNGTGSGTYLTFGSTSTTNSVTFILPGTFNSADGITNIGKSGVYLSSTPEKSEDATADKSYAVLFNSNGTATLENAGFRSPTAIRPSNTRPAK